MTPVRTRLEIRLMMPNIITIRPAVLKKIPDFELFCTEKELKLIRAKIGSVPTANESMVSPPVIKLPVDRV